MAAPRSIVDTSGNRVEVVIDIAEYRRLLDALEERESLRAYDAAKASNDEAISFEEAIRFITGKRAERYIQ